MYVWGKKIINILNNLKFCYLKKKRQKSMNSIKIPAQHQITFPLSLANPKPTRPSLIFSLYLSLHQINFCVLIKIGTCIWIQDQSFENPLKIVPIFCPSLKRSFLYINMDADSWSARLSSASKRYQSALQSRSGKLIHFFFFWVTFPLWDF